MNRLLVVTSAVLTSAVMTSVVVVTSPAAEAARPVQVEPGRSPSRAKVTLLDSIVVPAGTTQLGLPFGGLSGIDYDRTSKRYVAISDDRSENAPARFYTLELPIGAKGFRDRAPHLTGVQTLLDPSGSPFARRTVDPESIRWTPGGRSVLWSSEGASRSGQPAFVREATPDGKYLRELTLPPMFAPALSAGILTAGVRENQAIESLTLSPDGSKVIAATENALVQDGPAAGLNTESPSRVAVIDRATGTPQAQYVYSVDPIAFAPTAPLPPPINTYAADRGLSELMALNNTDYLAVERSFASGVGFTIRLYWTSTVGATDVRGKTALDGSEHVMTKHLLFDFASTSTDPDNVEGITWGPRLPDGAHTLVLVADDNFGFNNSVTKFHLLRVPARLARPDCPSTSRSGTAPVRRGSLASRGVH